MKRIRVRSSLGILFAAAGVACSDGNPSGPGGTTLVTPAGMVVSNAQTSSPIATSSRAGTSLSVSAAMVAYVSAVPGIFPGAVSAALGNRTRGGASRSVLVIDGGFDPVSIDAEAGDELSLTVFFNGVGSTPIMLKVPPRRPPEVVRTNPQKGRTDVALNVQVIVVFTEPVDESSVTSSSVALLRNGNAVSGRVQASADGLTAEFIPDGHLQPQATYSLVVNQGIHDLNGDALTDASIVTFTTAAVGAVIVTSATTATNNSDIDPDGYDVSVDGQPAQPISANGTVTVGNVSTGVHSVTLSGIAGNCSAGAATRQAEVVAGATTTVAFEVTCEPFPQFEGKIAFVSERDGNSEIYSINANGTGLLRLTNNAGKDVDPAWSPDGRRIAFASDRPFVGAFGRSDILVMDADGSNVVGLTTDGRNSAPAWSPDGREIAFSGVRDGQWGIYVMNLDNGTSRNVAHERGYQTDPAWSPDGSKIAFTSDWRAFDFLFDLYVANADGSGITVLLQGPFFSVDGLTFYFQPAWSPDGRKIAVVVCGYAWDNCYPNSTVAIANADGSELKTLVPTGGFARPAWSPDGSTIAFSSRACRECVGTLRYVRTDGSVNGLIFANGHSPSWHR